MSDPGYYKSNFRALTLREVARMQGWMRMPLAYLITRFKAPSPAGWMPQTWTELECTEAELSPRFLQAADAQRQVFRQLGFAEVGFKTIRRILNPHHRDSGGINFLGGDGRHFGQLVYTRVHAPPPINTDREQIVVAFTAAFGKDTLSCTNNCKTVFDSVPHHAVQRLASEDPAFLYRHFVEAVQRRRAEPRRFEDLPALRQWFDSDAAAVFQHRVRRKLFIRMNDEEVAKASRRLPPPLPRA